jgi:hypothetical protein
MKLLHALV